MRIHVGPEYRVYYARTGSTIYVLLAGGIKSSQTKDIAKAKKDGSRTQKGEMKKKEENNFQTIRRGDLSR